MSVPYWVQDSIFYQIFPDRFANGNPSIDPPNVHPWGSPPTFGGFQGGDLRGIIQHFDYLLDLGVNAIYLNPIFLASSNHRYNASDYLTIDPKLGDLNDFKALIDVAHRNDIRVVLDGVFNHCGRGFFAFNDILENQERSPYRDWFHISNFPVDAYTPGHAQDYLGWWKHKSLPKFNTHNQAVRRYLLHAARYWIEQGADGWRLDVPNEIDDDSFWAEFRDTIRAANTDAYLLGEIWDPLPRWVGDHHFDGLMNYPFRASLVGFLNKTLPASHFADELDKLLSIYPRENAYSMYLMLGSHDTERIATLLGRDLRKLKMAYLILFTFPGAPAIYYGDEIGMDGGKDPDCRRAFPWDREAWNIELRETIQHLIELRKRLPALRRGDYRRLLADDPRGCVIYSRGLGKQQFLVALNASSTRRQLRLPVNTLGWQDGHIVRNLIGTGEFIISGDTLSLSIEPWSGLLIQ